MLEVCNRIQILQTFQL